MLLTAAWFPRGKGNIPSGSIALNTTELGIIGQSGSSSPPNATPFYMGGYGTYTGTAPASMTGAWTNCGGGSATVHAMHTDVYVAGDFLVEVNAPATPGTNCTLTVTDNLGRSATGPVTTVTTNSGATTTFNVHNAPGWLPSHSYSPASGPKTRVNNGAGWSGSAWVPGAALKAYELTSGSCTSASSGGPSGTSASISDGTCTWKYLSDTDYVTLTGALKDAPPWVSGTVYTWGQYVTTNVGGVLRSYSLDQVSGTLGYAWCRSTAAPSGQHIAGGGNAGFGWFTAADGCVWTYMGDVVYSSQAEYMPVQTFVNYVAGSNPGGAGHMPHNYKIQLWNDAEYVAGSGSENNPITAADHYSGRIGGESNPAIYCPVGCRTTITAAPGESFGDTLTTSDALAGYDATKGVAIRNPNATGWFALAVYPIAFSSGDWNIILNGLQFKAPNGAAVLLTNRSAVTNNIIDGGSGSDDANNYGAGTALYVDLSTIIANNLILSHGTTGIGTKYGDTYILFNTIVNVGPASNTVAVAMDWNWIFSAVVVANSAIYSFAHNGAYLTGNPAQTFGASSAGNVTNIASGDSGTTWNGTTANGSTVITIPGTTYSQTGANMFVNPASDWRAGASLIGAGASYGNFTHGCIGAGSPSCTSNYDTPDFLGTTRPQAGSWTSGAEQHP